MKKNIREQLDVELSVWEAAIGKATDSIYGALISHLYTEHLLDRYIDVRVVIKDDYGKYGPSYSEKLTLVKEVGEIDRQLLDSLRKLNDIRNECAHVFGHAISKESIRKYGLTLGKDYKRIIKEYPDAGTYGIAPISWHVCGSLLYYVLSAEGYY